MLKSDVHKCFRACVFTASILLVPALFADVVELTPMVPPANGIYSLGDTCLPLVCLDNLALSNFDVISNQIVAGNELTVSNVMLTAGAFQNVSGTPGMFIGPVTLNGQVDITYFDKSTLSEGGTFNDELTSLDLSGSFGGHTIEAMLNPNQSSTGQTTITPIGVPPSAFKVNSFFDVFAELKIDNGAFVPGPERMAELTTTPEPAYLGAIGLLLAGIVTLRVVRSRDRTGIAG